MTSANIPPSGPPAAPLSRLDQAQGLGTPADGTGIADRGRVERAPDISEIIAAAVLAVPAVADLHGGSFGKVATYLPGRSVTGVRIRPDVTDIHVVLLWGAPVLAAAEQVRAAVMPLVEGLSSRVDVTVDDVIDPNPALDNATDARSPDTKPQPASL